MKHKSIFITAAILLVAVLAGAAQMYSRQQAQQTQARATQNREALMRFHAPTIGSAAARVQIVEFLDPACGTCAAFYPVVKKMLAEHPDEIRLSVRYAPFHQGSEEVVKALEASRKQGKFWQALEALLGSQAAWAQNHRANVDLVWPHLARAGLDTDRLKSDMQSPEIARLIAVDVQDATTLNVAATPEYFVNGRPLPSFGFEQLRALVDEELAATRQGAPHPTAVAAPT
jgi:protein-disulfide isomerase